MMFDQRRIAGKKVLVVGGTSGIGLAIAELASNCGAHLVLTARNHARLDAVSARLLPDASEAFDARDIARFASFLDAVGPIDHVFVAAGGPYYAALADIRAVDAGAAFADHVLLMAELARLIAPKMRRGGTLLFMAGTAARRPGFGNIIPGAVSAAMASAVASLALEIAPIRANVIAAGFVDTELSAALLGPDLNTRRDELRRKLPLGRVVTADDVAFLAVHLMENAAINGVVVDIDGGQQLVE